MAALSVCGGTHPTGAPGRRDSIAPVGSLNGCRDVASALNQRRGEVLVQQGAGQASGRAADSQGQRLAAIAQIDGVISSQNVTGPYDVIALVEGPTMDELGTFVIGQVQKTPDITRTLTCSVVNP